MLMIGAALALLAGACATTQDTPARYSIITLEKSVHFSAPDGADVMAAPGRYDVDSVDEATLRLIPAEAAAGTSSLIVAAMALPHEEPIESRVALSVPNGEDEHHIVLLMPDGKGLDAGGTYSGLRSRGGSIAPLPMVQVQAAFAQQGLVVRVPLAAPTFYVVSYGGKCLDFGAPPQVSAAPVFIYGCNGTIAQQVQVQEINGQHEVILRAGPKVIGVKRYTPIGGKGAPIQLLPQLMSESLLELQDLADADQSHNGSEVCARWGQYHPGGRSHPRGQSAGQPRREPDPTHPGQPRSR